jgi:impB/mucB/samB family
MRCGCRCPDLVVIPYEFEAYQEVSETIYRILLQYVAVVQPMSCDEAYLDITGCTDAMRMAEQIRSQIRQATGCNASVGIGPNILLANMATKKAKPDGVFQIDAKVLLAHAHFSRRIKFIGDGTQNASYFGSCMLHNMNMHDKRGPFCRTQMRFCCNRMYLQFRG